MMSIALADAPPPMATVPLTLRLRQETRPEHERI